MKPNLLKKNWSRFISSCLKMSTMQDFDELFDCVLTAAEREDIAARVAILIALLEGDLTQRDMAEKLGVSIAKITRCSNGLRIAAPKVKKVLQDS